MILGTASGEDFIRHEKQFLFCSGECDIKQTHFLAFFPLVLLIFQILINSGSQLDTAFAVNHLQAEHTVFCRKNRRRRRTFIERAFRMQQKDKRIFQTFGFMNGFYRDIICFLTEQIGRKFFAAFPEIVQIAEPAA